MTTNVRDSAIGEFATDSRWSIDLRVKNVNAILFVDDNFYSKIVGTSKRAYMFAGSSNVIDQWKTGIKSAEADPYSVNWNTLPVNGMAISIVNLEDGSIAFEYGHEIRLPDERAATVSFAGSGSVSACTCWQLNRDPRKAVESAKNCDLFTGGAVRYFEFSTRDNNLVIDLSLTELQNTFINEGMIMDMNLGPNSKPVPVKEVVTGYANLTAALESVRIGELSPTAPCDAVFNTWTDKQRNKLVAAMDKTYPKMAI